MKVRPTLFNSASEAELFQAVHGTWEPHYRVFPEVPFANLIEPDERKLRAEELAFLHKTSVDLVLTAPDWRPLFALEFDGLGHGYSRNGVYVQRAVAARDPNRAWKLGLKARVAAAAGLPFVIVSYDEKAVIDRETGLTIVHGIFGQYLAACHAAERMGELYEADKDVIDAMPSNERADYVQDYVVISAEVEADIEWNPIYAEASRLRARAFELAPISRSGHQPLHDPPRPDFTTPLEPGFSMSAFHDWWTSIRRWGAECWVETGRGRVTSGPVWVRNFESRYTSPMILAEEIAELVAWRAAVRALES